MLCCHTVLLSQGDGKKKKPKFDKEVRFCLGVGMKKVGGKLKGEPFEPFEYTGAILRGPSGYSEAERAEIARVNALTSQKKTKKGELTKGAWVSLDAKKAKRLEGGRYEMRYGDSWRAELKKALSTSSVNVTEMMDHIVATGNTFYADTPFASSWVIFHDALNQWWEPLAQAHLLSLGFPPSRQICAQGSTNQGGRYKGKLVGNSPELCPLDSNLFSDLEYSIKQHVALTCHLDVKNTKRFKVGTPDELSKTLRRCWKVAVTSDRIVCDIKRWPVAIEAIVAARGAKVPELDNRHGRRATPALRMHPVGPRRRGGGGAAAREVGQILGQCGPMSMVWCRYVGLVGPLGL